MSYFAPDLIGGQRYFAPDEPPGGGGGSTVTSVTVSPTSITQASGTIQFTVTVNGTGSPSQATTAVIVGPGSINGSNLYTVPSQTGPTQTATITWTSVQDPTKPPGVATVYIPGTDTPSMPIVAIATIMRKSTVNLTAPLTGAINVTANLL